jgi:hypothetical protein
MCREGTMPDNGCDRTATVYAADVEYPRTVVAYSEREPGLNVTVCSQQLPFHSLACSLDVLEPSRRS